MVVAEGPGEPAAPSASCGLLPVAPNMVAFSRLPRFICFFPLSLDVELGKTGPVKKESLDSVTEEQHFRWLPKSLTPSLLIPLSTCPEDGTLVKTSIEHAPYFPSTAWRRK